MVTTGMCHAPLTQVALPATAPTAYARPMASTTPTARTAKAAVIIVLAVVAAQLSLVLLFRGARRNRAALLRHDSFRRLLKAANAASRKKSGTRQSDHGLLTHTGRKSGRSYETSLGVNAYGDGFLVPLTYGTATDWFRNLSASGGTLEWRGQTFHVELPEIVGGPEPMRSWPMASRIVLQAVGIDQFALLHQKPNERK